jgi:hypothetical protein
MDHVVKTLVEMFLGFVLGDEEWLDVPSQAFPEIEYINGSISDR